MSNFDFIPRKLARKVHPSDVTNGVATRNANTKGEQRPVTSTTSVEDAPTTSNQKTASWKGKGKEIERGSGKVLRDEDYCDLLWLSLSDHAIWSSQELYEDMEGRDGFVDLRTILDSSPLFAVLPSVPPESTLARSAKQHPLFEVRMIVVADSWATSSSGLNRGGFEIRRTDWSKVKDRIRKYTSFYWEGKTVYVENIPVASRSKQAIVRLVYELLRGHTGLVDSQQPLVECVHLPPHRDDKPDAPEPLKCKGFAFVTLSSSNDVDSLLEKWPWTHRKSPDERETKHKAAYPALESGLRTLAKREWEKLKEEYLSYQQQLLADAANSNAPAPRPRRRVEDDRNEIVQNAQPPDCLPSPPSRQTTYPLDCLIFVKNIQPDTNKTTLKKLFSLAFDEPEGHIDYVDYTKGLDTCYLRLSSSSSARQLVGHFDTTPTSQSNGLDGEGTKSTSSNAISMELVQGRREELYWEKVPLKIRQQAMVNANAASSVQVEDDSNENKRKHKRRKHN